MFAMTEFYRNVVVLSIIAVLLLIYLAHWLYTFAFEKGIVRICDFYKARNDLLLNRNESLKQEIDDLSGQVTDLESEIDSQNDFIELQHLGYGLAWSKEKNGLMCPHCHCEDPEGISFYKIEPDEHDDSLAYQDGHCSWCDGEWRTVYTVTDVVEIPDGDGLDGVVDGVDEDDDEQSDEATQ